MYTFWKPLFLLFFLFLGCVNQQDKLIISGSSSLASLMTQVSKRFMKDNSNTAVHVRSNISSIGISSVRDKTADIGMVAIKLDLDDSDLRYHPIAVDAIGIIVNQKNIMNNLTYQNVIDIYTGKITDWEQLKGIEGRIRVIFKNPPECSISKTFLSYFKLEAQSIQADTMVKDNKKGIEILVHDPFAIGFFSIGFIQSYRASQGSLKILSLDGVYPSTLNVLERKFKLFREFQLVTHVNATDQIKSFLNFMIRNALDLIREQHFIPDQSIEFK